MIKQILGSLGVVAVVGTLAVTTAVAQPERPYPTGRATLDGQNALGPSAQETKTSDDHCRPSIDSIQAP